MSIDKAMGNGIHCARCTFVTLQLKPSDMYCPWCMGEAKARIAELEAMVREFLAEDIDGRESCRLDRKGKPRKDCRCIQCKAIALLQPEAGKP